MDNQMIKQAVNNYLDGHCSQSRPTIWGILQNTPCNSQFKAFDLYREWIIEKHKEKHANQSEDTKQESKTETPPENQEVESKSDSL